MKYDYLIVGAGLFGSIFAHQAIKNKKSVIIIDKRGHIGGNCFTDKQDGIDVHVYGPHIFRTSSEEIWKFINQFAKFNNFVNRPKVSYQDKLYSFPINLFTLYQLWGVTNPSDAIKKLNEVKIIIDKPRNLEEVILSKVGKEIYEKFFYGYTKKQWMRDPKDLPASIIKRLPIRLTHDDNYFNDTYQGIPIGGYTSIFQKLLDGCKVELGADYFSNREKYDRIADNVVYTGRLDEFFNYVHGNLDYRALRFEHTKVAGDFQGNAVINYTEEHIPWTRITEHKHFQVHELDKLQMTIYTKEFPEIWEKDKIPYYPIEDSINIEKRSKYNKLKESLPNFIFGGRLAEYRYYDMHQVIASALHEAKKYGLL